MGNFIFKRCLRQREFKVLLVGLDGAGKSALLYRLKLGKTVQMKPTMGYNTETVRHRNVRLAIWDVGVRDRTRTLVKHYLPGTDCLVFVVDSTDRERLVESFLNVLEPVTQEPAMESVPVLVLANKQDVDGAMDPKELRVAVENSGHLESRTWQVFGVSATHGTGLTKCLDWVTASLSKRDKCANKTPSVSEPNMVTLDTRGDIGARDEPRSSLFAGLVTSIRRSVLRR